jgi:hypothetical protein
MMEVVDVEREECVQAKKESATEEVPGQTGTSIKIATRLASSQHGRQAGRGKRGAARRPFARLHSRRSRQSIWLALMGQRDKDLWMSDRHV